MKTDKVPEIDDDAYVVELEDKWALLEDYAYGLRDRVESNVFKQGNLCNASYGEMVSAHKAGQRYAFSCLIEEMANLKRNGQLSLLARARLEG